MSIANFLKTFTPPAVLPAAKLDNATMGVGSFLTILAGLVGLSLFVDQYEIESSLGLINLMLVIVPGFAIYAVLPLRWRMPFFLLLSVVTLFLVYDGLVGLAVLLFILGFTWMTSLAITWSWKVGITVLAFVGLIILRSRIIPFLPGSTVAQVTGGLLMFRSILYLYEIRFEKARPNVWLRLNYFLLLPNLIFYLFPIVDYKTFVRGLYAKPAVDLAFRGLRWMLLGLFQFMGYRILYSYFLPATSGIQDIYDLLQYLIVSYTLILRLAAIFNFSAGVICLFGFDLPPTFNYLFLASSFSDLWKRINVYWRDFVMKVLYFPIYFQFKKRNGQAIFITILIVFFFNWLMHGYQWFWIRGNFLLKANDVLFWTILGVFMAISAVLQSKVKRKYTKRVSEFRPVESLLTSAKIIGMLTVMSLLWSFWVSSDFASWWHLLTNIEAPELSDVGLMLSGFIGLTLLGGAVQYCLYFMKWSENAERLERSYVLFFGLIAGMLLFSNTTSKAWLQINAPFSTGGIFTSQLNNQDEELAFEGYYDELIVSNNFAAGQVLRYNQKRRSGWKTLTEIGMVSSGPHAMHKELVPDTTTVFKGELFSTNADGLRDQNYTFIKPEGTFRIALLGGSLQLGSGVADGENFESNLEDSLNQHFVAAFPVEIVNFAVAGIHLPQHVAIAERKVLPYKPDLLIYSAHYNELNRSARVFGRSMLEEEELKNHPFLSALADSLELNTEMSEEQYTSLMLPHKERLYRWGLKRLAKACSEQNIKPVYVYFPIPGEQDNPEERRQILSLAEEYGFYTMDMFGIFPSDVPFGRFTLTEYDFHPNSIGHQLIGDSLYHRILNDDYLLEVMSEYKIQRNTSDTYE